MERKPNRFPPLDEDHVNQILSNLQPAPRENFYRRMGKSPWMKFHHLAKPKTLILLTPRLVLTVVLLTCLFFAAWPGLEVLARQVSIFFLPNTSDTLRIEISTPAAGDILILQPDFDLSLKEAQAQAGFNIYQIDVPGITFQGATFDAALHSVMQFFTGAGYNLYLVQRLKSSGINYFSIGASATVEQITVRGVSGEYVYGGWKGISMSDPAATPNLLQATWDAEQPQHTLRWSEGEYTFEMRCHGALCPPKDDLVEMAGHLR